MCDLAIELADPLSDELGALVARHLAYARAHTPPENICALDTAGLDTPDITLWAVREQDGLIAMGALRELDAAHGELKSMHTLEEARGRGLGELMARHLLAQARARGYERVSLETGSQAGFAAARALYVKLGFEPCGPFADYTEKPGSVFYTLDL